MPGSVSSLNHLVERKGFGLVVVGGELVLRDVMVFSSSWVRFWSARSSDWQSSMSPSLRSPAQVQFWQEFWVEHAMVLRF